MTRRRRHWRLWSRKCPWLRWCGYWRLLAAGHRADRQLVSGPRPGAEVDTGHTALSQILHRAPCGEAGEWEPDPSCITLV